MYCRIWCGKEKPLIIVLDIQIAHTIVLAYLANDATTSYDGHEAKGYSEE